jgi:hypothetical protein
MKKIIISLIIILASLAIYAAVSDDSKQEIEEISIGNNKYCVLKGSLIKSDQLGLFVSTSENSLMVDVSQSEIERVIGNRAFVESSGLTLLVEEKRTNYSAKFFDDFYKGQESFNAKLVSDELVFGLVKTYREKDSLFWFLTKQGSNSSDGFIASCIESKGSFSCNRKLFHEDLFIEYDIHGDDVKYWEDIDMLAIDLLKSWECES